MRAPKSADKSISNSTEINPWLESAKVSGFSARGTLRHPSVHRRWSPRSDESAKRKSRLFDSREKANICFSLRFAHCYSFQRFEQPGVHNLIKASSRAKGCICNSWIRKRIWCDVFPPLRRCPLDVFYYRSVVSIQTDPDRWTMEDA